MNVEENRDVIDWKIFLFPKFMQQGINTIDDTQNVPTESKEYGSKYNGKKANSWESFQ